MSCSNDGRGLESTYSRTAKANETDENDLGPWMGVEGLDARVPRRFCVFNIALVQINGLNGLGFVFFDHVARLLVSCTSL